MRLIDADKIDVIFRCAAKFKQNQITGTTWSNALNEAADKIDEQPTIDAELIRYGHWIECESENGIYFHECSECGQRDMYKGTFTDQNGRGFSFYFKRQYCPVCGARMEIANEDAD